MVNRALVTAAVAIGLLAGGAQGRDRAEAEKVGAVVAPYLGGGWVRGVVVGVVDKDGPRSYGFGQTGDGAGAKAPDGRTVFEIASVTKTFTALVLADMAERGEVRLDDLVEKYLPAGVVVPKTDKPMTLLALATHHSGLPRMPHNFRPADPANPYADYTADKLYAFLPAARVHPTATFEYSNVGFGLLGDLLARRAGVSYEALVVGRVCDPLGMADTRLTLTADMRARLAAPFDADLRPDHTWDLPGIPGGGALRSTADDMLRYAGAQLGLGAKVPAGLARAIAATHVPHDSAPGGQEICLAWHRGKDGRLVHNGQTGGYHSFVAIDEEAGVGVVVLANTATMRADGIGGGAMRVACGLAPAAAKLPVAVVLPATTLDRYAGRYGLPGAGTLLVTREGDRLVTLAPGQTARRIYPLSEREFFSKTADATGMFEVGEAGEVAALLIAQDGRVTRAERVR